MNKFIKDITNQHFGLLLVKEYAYAKRGTAYWKCVCDCGSNKEVITSGASLRRGASVSCGCVRLKNLGKIHKRNKKYPNKDIKTYRCWNNILERCLNPNGSGYKYYGARGITVCERWLDFNNFFEDMGEIPKNYQIHRIDGDLGYFKENCVWATRKTQMRNFSRNRWIEIDGFIKPLCEWLEIFNMTSNRFQKRINKGMSEYDAITKPSLTPWQISKKNLITQNVSSEEQLDGLF